MSTRDTHPEWVDEFGLAGPLPADDGQRLPPDQDWETGPQVGARLPDFTLPSSTGETVSFHQDRGQSKAAVVFIRSAVW